MFSSLFIRILKIFKRNESLKQMSVRFHWKKSHKSEKGYSAGSPVVVVVVDVEPVIVEVATTHRPASSPAHPHKFTAVLKRSSYDYLLSQLYFMTMPLLDSCRDGRTCSPSHKD